MTIERIRLVDVLPKVFAGAETESPIKDSEVWMRDMILKRGGRYLIEAESGTGKSSLCAFLYGMRTDYMGHIYFDDTDLSTIPISGWCDIRRNALALLPQDMRLFPELTAIENVQIKNRLTRHLTDREIEDMFDRMDISTKLLQPVSRLSIGQQQRVAVIRALAQPFSFIILDEPVSHLDQRNNLTVAQMVADHAQRQGAGIISTSVGNPLLLTDATHIRL